jgi:tetratricopeptide (TPR) repeat protein
MLRAVGLLLLSCCLIGAAETDAWVRVSDGTISVYTQQDPAQASAILTTFGELRHALAQASAFQVNETAALKVIAFKSEKEFNQYRLNSGSCAFYQQTQRSEYVVLQDLAPSHRDVSAHEFTHFVLAHSNVNLPLWLNEGMADFYSTFQLSGDRVVFGRIVNGRLPVLRNGAWIPLAKLFEISTASPYYSDPVRMVLFYSESWALTHMLVADPGYAERFPYFLRAVSEGHSSAEALGLIYNKTPAQVQEDLRDYVDQQHLPIIEARLKTPYTPLSSSTTPISAAEMDVALGDLIPNNAATQAALANRLASAATKLIESADAEESLGYLALRQGKMSDARAHFRLAVERHSSDPNVFFYLAHFDHEAGEPASEVIPLLERALAMKPDLMDARLELALVATADGDFKRALEALRNLTVVRPENAYAAAYAEAYCYTHLEKFKEAHASALRAKNIAANDHDRAEVSELLGYIDEQIREQSP